MHTVTATLDPRRWRALALLAVAQFVVVLDASIMNIALPSIGTELHASTDTLSWVINAYLLAFGGLLLLGGRLADLLGRRRVFMAGLVVFGLASLAGGLAASSAQLIVARAVQGAGGALLAPAALSIVTTLFAEGAERNKALGVWGAVAGSGGVAGVLLGGVLTSALGWEWVLFVNVPLALGAAALAPRMFGETRSEGGSRRVDVAGAVTVTAGMAGAVYALVDTNVALGAAAAALLAAFVAIEARVAEPLMPLSTFRLAYVRSANVTMVGAGAAMLGLFFFLSLYLQQVLGYTALEAGVSQLPLAGSLVVAAGGAGSLAERVGVKPVLLAGLALFAGGLAWFSRISADGTFVVDILGPSLLVGVGLAATFVALTIGSVTGVDGDRYGLASGLVNTSQQIGGALGLAILTAVAGHSAQAIDGYRLALLVAAGIAVLALAAAALLTPAPERAARRALRVPAR